MASERVSPSATASCSTVSSTLSTLSPTLPSTLPSTLSSTLSSALSSALFVTLSTLFPTLSSLASPFSPTLSSTLLSTLPPHLRSLVNHLALAPISFHSFLLSFPFFLVHDFPPLQLSQCSVTLLQLRNVFALRLTRRGILLQLRAFVRLTRRAVTLLLLHNALDLAHHNTVCFLAHPTAKQQPRRAANRSPGALGRLRRCFRS
mmetsp:Transcript_11641/g.26587  ORF Transcript_11641/g.26587 Transcript_11641/m.26587 type:complete len:204 (-) Transcript_11641:1738-2349(-)